jgi:CheY-like chemotaxis protein
LRFLGNGDAPSPPAPAFPSRAPRKCGAFSFVIAGFQVVEAGNAQEALEFLRTLTAVHLLFTDINMPGRMDGVSLAHRALKQCPHIGIIIVSGQGAPHSDALPRGARFHASPRIKSRPA